MSWSNHRLALLAGSLDVVEAANKVRAAMAGELSPRVQGRALGNLLRQMHSLVDAGVQPCAARALAQAALHHGQPFVLTIRAELIGEILVTHRGGAPS